MTYILKLQEYIEFFSRCVLYMVIFKEIQKKDLIYELIDNHSSRPGHDLRYSLDPGLLKSLGWEPKIKLSKRIEEVVNWSLKNKHWLSQN